MLRRIVRRSTGLAASLALAWTAGACRAPAGAPAPSPAPSAIPASLGPDPSRVVAIAAPLPKLRAPLSLVLNVPAYRLDVFERDSFVRSFDVAVGMRKYPTPRGSFAIRTIEWNPWWVPPASPWAAKEKTTPPGPDNPMGRVKLYMLPLYFLHGTPFENSIGSAASHGCVRLRNRDAIDLALLVHRFGTPSVRDATIDSVEQDLVNTRRFTVELPVPIAVRYDRVELRGDRLVVYPDIYRVGPRLTVGDLLAALGTAGVDTNEVDDSRLRLLLRRAQQGRASITIDSLLSNGRR